MYLTLRLIKVSLIKTVGTSRGQINQQNRKPKNRPILIHTILIKAPKQSVLAIKMHHSNLLLGKAQLTEASAVALLDLLLCSRQGQLTLCRS